MDRRMLSPEEREEYDAMLYEAGYDDFAVRRKSNDIGEKLHRLLLDAQQAGRPWAEWVLEADACAGHLSRFKRWDKERYPIEVNHESVLVRRSELRGVRRKSPETGETAYQQELFRKMSWDEVEQVMDGALARVAAERITISTCRKLLALHLRAPGSTGPADACARLGLDLDAYLASDEAAA